MPGDILMDIIYDLFMQPWSEEMRPTIHEKYLDVPLGKTYQQTDQAKQERAAALKAMLGK